MAGFGANMITSMGLEKLGFTLKDFVLQDDGGGAYIKEWFSDKPRPTTADIEAAHAEWQVEYDAQEYARNREAEYPSVADQLDKIYHDGINEWKKVIKATKDKYPKP